jgi:hypothetical protein
MITVEKSIFINKPAQDVWAFTTAEGGYMKYQVGVTEVIEGKGPRHTVGSTFTEVRKFMGQEMRTTIEVTAIEPNAKWAGKVIKGPVPYEVTTTYEDSNGGMKYTTKVVGEPKGFFKLAEGLVASQLEKSLGEDLQKLKVLVEEG